MRRRGQESTFSETGRMVVSRRRSRRSGAKAFGEQGSFAVGQTVRARVRTRVSLQAHRRVSSSSVCLCPRAPPWDSCASPRQTFLSWSCSCPCRRTREREPPRTCTRGRGPIGDGYARDARRSGKSAGNVDVVRRVLRPHPARMTPPTRRQRFSSKGRARSRRAGGFRLQVSSEAGVFFAMEEALFAFQAFARMHRSVLRVSLTSSPWQATG